MGGKMEFTPFMFAVMIIAFIFTSYFMGMLIHSAFIYEDKGSVKKDSKTAWILSWAAGSAVTGWLYYYGYYVNFGR